MLPDQLRPDFLSCYGADFIDTPNIDWIANNGTRYDRAYSASPVCVPARTALLTGMNAIRNGVADNLHAVRGDYNDVGIQTWPQILANAGYYTSAVGKMHFYSWDARRGFQCRVIAEDKRWLQVRDDYYHYLKEQGLRKLHGNEHEGYFKNRGAIINRLPSEHNVDRFVGREACRFIENYGGDGPFAMMVGFPGPPCPYDPASDFPENFKPEDMPEAVPEVVGDAPKLRQQNIDGTKRHWNGVDYTEFNDSHKQKIRAHYAGLVKHIHHEVVAIIDALRQQGLLDNTVIKFFHRPRRLSRRPQPDRKSVILRERVENPFAGENIRIGARPGLQRLGGTSGRNRDDVVNGGSRHPEAHGLSSPAWTRIDGGFSPRANNRHVNRRLVQLRRRVEAGEVCHRRVGPF